MADHGSDEADFTSDEPHRCGEGMDGPNRARSEPMCPTGARSGAQPGPIGPGVATRLRCAHGPDARSATVYEKACGPRRGIEED